MSREDEQPDPQWVEEETLVVKRAEPAPPSAEASTRRMVRDAAFDAAVRGQIDDDDWDDDIPEDLPELAGTAKMPAHVERRALPFRKRDGGGRQNDPSLAAPFTGGAAPTQATWAQADSGLDLSQLPSALAPSDPPPAKTLRGEAEEGTVGVVIALGVFVVLALVLVAVAAFGV